DVGDADGGHAPALLDFRLVVQDALARPPQHRQDAHAGADELESILVRGDEDEVDVGVAEPADDGGEDVVRLVARSLEDGQPEGLERPPHRRELLDEVLRHPRALDLVLGEPLVAKGGTLGVPGDAHVVRPILAEELPQHHGEAEGGVGRQAARGREVGDGVVGAVEVGRTVDEIEGRHAQLPTTRAYSPRTNSATSRWRRTRARPLGRPASRARRASTWPVWGRQSGGRAWASRSERRRPRSKSYASRRARARSAGSRPKAPRHSSAPRVEGMRSPRWRAPWASWRTCARNSMSISPPRPNLRWTR